MIWQNDTISLNFPWLKLDTLCNCNLIGWLSDFPKCFNPFFIISFMLISGSWNSLFRHIWNWEWIISICVRFMRRILLFFELKKLFNLPPNLVLFYFSLVLESETCFGELQWKCWIAGIDTCWKSKGCSNISRVHDFLFHSWWVNHVTLSLSLSLSLSLLKVQYCLLAVPCRKIWSCFCFNSSSNYCSFILPFLCLRWYVLLNFLSSYHIIQFKAKKSQFFHHMNRFSRSQYPPVLQPKQLQNEVYSWVLCFHGPFNTTILQWVHSNSWLWPSPHWCKMGNCLWLSPSD